VTLEDVSVASSIPMTSFWGNCMNTTELRLTTELQSKLTAALAAAVVVLVTLLL
jgi:hypothetical protein